MSDIKWNTTKKAEREEQERIRLAAIASVREYDNFKRKLSKFKRSTPLTSLVDRAKKFAARQRDIYAEYNLPVPSMLATLLDETPERLIMSMTDKNAITHDTLGVVEFKGMEQLESIPWVRKQMDRDEFMCLVIDGNQLMVVLKDTYMFPIGTLKTLDFLRYPTLAQMQAELAKRKK